LEKKTTLDPTVQKNILEKLSSAEHGEHYRKHSQLEEILKQWFKCEFLYKEPKNSLFLNQIGDYRKYYVIN
jgi:hypothetical protein